MPWLERGPPVGAPIGGEMGARRTQAWHAACAQAGVFGTGTWDVPRRKGVANQLLREWIQRLRAILARANHRMWERSTGQAGHPARAELRVL